MLTLKPSYQEAHVFLAVRIAGFSSSWFDLTLAKQDIKKIGARIAQTEGPIFATFIAADFSSFAGFMAAADRIGLDWLSTIDTTKPAGNESLAVCLRRKYKIAGPATYEKRIVTGGPISGQFVEKYYQAIKKPLNHHQKIIQEITSAALTSAAKDQIKTWQDDIGEGFYKPDRPDLVVVNRYIDTINEARAATDYDVIAGPYDVCIARRFQTLLARLYAEVVDGISDNVRLAPCQNCGVLSILKANEKYCGRLVPPYDLGRTCKDVGPAVSYLKSLEADEAKAAYRKEYNRRTQALVRLKAKAGKDSKEYKALLEDFTTWKEINRPERKGR